MTKKARQKKRMREKRKVRKEEEKRNERLKKVKTKPVTFPIADSNWGTIEPINED